MVSLLIVRRNDCTVVLERYIGMGAVREKMKAVLNRSPEVHRKGFETYLVKPIEVLEIAQEHYSGGLDPLEAFELSNTFLAEDYIWSLHHNS